MSSKCVSSFDMAQDERVGAGFNRTRLGAPLTQVRQPSGKNGDSLLI